MHTDRDELFRNLWNDYKAVTPSAEKIHRLLADTQGGTIVNDHIALRTFDIDKTSLDKLAAHFLALGYFEGGEYHFEGKKLYAKHFEHEDPAAPKVFISELLVEKCSPELKAIVHGLVEQMDPEAVQADDFLYSGPHWQINYATYKELLAESEYAAWVAAWGFRANHFTVSVNELERFSSIEEINQVLKDEGFAVNSSGGEVKGSPDDLLEQSSTMADRVDVRFKDKIAAIPSCFYEFALRYRQPDGKLYSGFVPASADKIFESTNAGM
ncbi:DUF1338 domain-containing protein [Marinobacter salicampi]|uniref:DUF1338 domain-containing protein n=1 Tax=Marinobacter salicampi TaxID=435907 RepID=UPI00140BA4F5|nr:DUF1338 domain-containing protein [Marinobacter salicampi]